MTKEEFDRMNREATFGSTKAGKRLAQVLDERGDKKLSHFIQKKFVVYTSVVGNVRNSNLPVPTKKLIVEMYTHQVLRSLADNNRYDQLAIQLLCCVINSVFQTDLKNYTEQCKAAVSKFYLSNERNQKLKEVKKVKTQKRKGTLPLKFSK